MLASKFHEYYSVVHNSICALTNIIKEGSQRETMPIWPDIGFKKLLKDMLVDAF